MTEYHKQYKNFKKEVVIVVRELLKKRYGIRYYRQDAKRKLFLLNCLNNHLCNLYGIEQSPKIIIDNSSEGYYNFLTRTIAVNNKLSLITFLHEFKHFLQIEKNKPNSEGIARGYSISLFYQASPYHFNRAFNDSLIIHEKP